MNAASEQSEKEFQSQVIRLAGLHGWLTYHTFSSRRSPSGFPDLVLAHPGRGKLLFAELKRQGGGLTDAQYHWLVVLRMAGQDVRLWRPGDWPEIERVLAGGG